MYLVFDIGGTNTRLAVSEDGVSFGSPKRILTPKDFEEGVRQIAYIARELANGRTIEAMAGGVAGPLNREKTMLVNSPHLAEWVDKPLAEKLSQAINAPVYLENDTALVGLGEAIAGAGRGYGIVAYITVSTGVGGVRIVDNTIDRSARGFEIGHQIIDTEGKTLEEQISGSAFEKRYAKKPYEVTDANVWEEAARVLAVGINNTIVYWSPDIVVLGGSMITGSPAISFERTQEHLRSMMHIFPHLPDMRKAALGDVGGLHGALAYMHTRHSML